MAKMVLIEQNDEENAPPTNTVLSVSYTPPYPEEPNGTLWLAIGKYDEHNDGEITGHTFDFANAANVGIDREDLLRALIALGAINQVLQS